MFVLHVWMGCEGEKMHASGTCFPDPLNWSTAGWTQFCCGAPWSCGSGACAQSCERAEQHCPLSLSPSLPLSLSPSLPSSYACISTLCHDLRANRIAGTVVELGATDTRSGSVTANATALTPRRSAAAHGGIPRVGDERDDARLHLTPN